MTGPDAGTGRNLTLRTLPNLRDLGGYRTGGKSTVATGRIFRSVELGRISDPDLETVRKLGLRTVFDFRTTAEIEMSPDRDVGARQVPLDVMADREGPGPASLISQMGDPAAVSRALEDGRAANLMKTAYQDLITLPSARRSYAAFFTTLATAGTLPALFHCTTGKDRTGWAAASLLLFLGVGEEDVFHDYLLTNEQLLPALEPTLDEAESMGVDRDLLRPVLGVDRRYLEAAIDRMTTDYGDIDGYMSRGLGLGDSLLSRLRDRLVEPA